MAGDIPLAPVAVHLGQAVSLPRVRVPLGEAEMRVEVERGTVTANHRLLRLALINLVRNAAQHGYGGGPGIVTVRADPRGISVIDDGPGMDPAQITEVLTNPTLRCRVAWRASGSLRQLGRGGARWPPDAGQPRRRRSRGPPRAAGASVGF